MIINVQQLKEGDTFKMIEGDNQFAETPRTKSRNRTVRIIESFKPSSVTITTTYCGYAYTFPKGKRVELLMKP
jgi:16S rRNA U1498 N3-methylase RsmE